MKFYRTMLLLLGAVSLTAGCSTAAAQSNFSVFKNIPASELKALKTEVAQAHIQNLEVPTRLPFIVQHAHVPNGSVQPGVLSKRITIFMGNSTEVIEETVFGGAGLPSNFKVNAQLSDGTQAVYANNATVSDLAWSKDNVFYTISSSKQVGKTEVPDLTESQLIKVADSFQ